LIGCVCVVELAGCGGWKGCGGGVGGGVGGGGGGGGGGGRGGGAYWFDDFEDISGVVVGVELGRVEVRGRGRGVVARTEANRKSRWDKTCYIHWPRQLSSLAAARCLMLFYSIKLTPPLVPLLLAFAPRLTRS